MLIRILTALLVLLLATAAFLNLRPAEPNGPPPRATTTRPSTQPFLAAETAGAPRTYPPVPTRDLSGDLPKTGQWRGKPACGDLNGDGKLDLVASIRRINHKTAGEGIHVWLGDGKGQWRPVLEGLRRDMGYGGAALGDVNGDGRLDIAFSGHDVPPHLFLNLVEVDNQSSWVPSAKGLDITCICADVALADFNHDGKLDLAAIGQFPAQGGLFVFLGDGEGGFTRDAELFDKKHYGARVIAADIDGDGVPELVAATDLGPRVWTRSSTGEWTEMSEGLESSAIGGSDLVVTCTDIDQDGKLDLITAGMEYAGHPGLRLYRWSQKRWSKLGDLVVGAEHVFDATVLRTGKMASCALVAATKSGLLLFDISKDGSVTITGRLANSDGPLNVTAADIDGDGRDEVVYVGFAGVHVLQLIRADSSPR